MQRYVLKHWQSQCHTRPGTAAFVMWRINRTALRRGATVHEAVAATLMSMMAIAGVAQLVAIDARQWIAAQQRATAVREAGNLMEEVFCATVERSVGQHDADAWIAGCERERPA